MKFETLEPRHMLSVVHDVPPDYAADHDTVAVADGSWFNASTWSNGVPALGMDARIDGHSVVIGQPQATVEHFLVWQQNFGSPVYAAVEDLTVGAGASLSFDAASDTTLHVQTLMVMGALEVGTEARPIIASAELVFTDAPIDTDFDPEQFGHGLIVMGDGVLSIHGATLSETFVRLAKEPLAGATSIELAEPVAGWNVGDTLVLADTRELAARFHYDQREEAVISSISGDGKMLGLTTALRFSHVGARDPDGVILYLPHVANLTRNVVLRSENPDGTRAHGIFTDHAAVDIAYAAFEDFGRTTAADHLDSTVIQNGEVKHLGTNQIGRYALHFHHAAGPDVTPSHGYEFRLQGNAVNGSPKWGIAIHDSHYGLIDGNVVYNAIGAGIVTEDGNETGNRIQGNYILGNDGSGGHLFSREGGANPTLVGDGTPGNPFRTNGDIGHEGVGIWMHGAHNYVTDNVIANSAAAGVVVWGRLNANQRIPLFQGADMHQAGEYRVADVRTLQPFDFSGNEIYASSQGLMFDGTSDFIGSAEVFVVNDTTIWHPGALGVSMSYNDRFEFHGLTIIGSAAGYATGFGHGFLTHVTGTDWDFQNLKIGAIFSIAVTLEDSYFRNREVNVLVQDMLTSPEESTLSNVRHGVIAGKPSKAIAYRWVPSVQYRSHLVNHTLLVYDHNGVPGDDFQLFLTEQHADYVVPSSGMGSGALTSVVVQTNAGPVTAYKNRLAPVAGLTNEQLFQQYGVALAGRVAPRNAATRSNIVGLLGPIPTELVAPVIELQSVNIIHDSPTTVTIKWTTDEPSNSVVEYDVNKIVDVRNGVFAPADNRLVTDHRITLTGLTPLTTYAFRVYSTDASRNMGWIEGVQLGSATELQRTLPVFLTRPVPPAAMPPVQTVHLQAEAMTDITARIVWFSDQAATTQLEFADDNYQNRVRTAAQPSLVYTHEIELTGLVPGKRYAMRTISRGADGIERISGWRFFAVPVTN